ncbi:bifunctional (p)ppGpp synthetase/guanosine-3',5'-bis(diphosphate) 3'-pyrophosphohydrolase [bacterium CPR1]|nr:bifunctional (p)ppGpp synthetase/guanosine-3',5'-bis(diphosphate) 3'-pyrophosphohydrolase [bacterium CPR1]
MLFEAIEFAAAAHRGQYRKASRVPYIVHPLGVMRILIAGGAEEELAAAGVLHDVVEDTEVTPDQLLARFGGEVSRLVLAVSEPDKSLAWEERKLHTLEFLAHQARPDEVLLALADKLDNVESMLEDLELLGSELWCRFKRGRDQQAWYYRGLLGSFQRRLDSPLVDRYRLALERLFEQS